MVTSAINAFYFPGHRLTPFASFDAEAAQFAIIASTIAAIASSIALALKFRAAAAGLVVATWGVIALGTPAARSLVQPGPEFFVRHLGKDKLLVPWQYGLGSPGSAAENPHEVGLSVSLCLTNLKGTFDNDCLGGKQLYVTPKNLAFADFDMYRWRRRDSEMNLEPERDGYQSYSYRYTGPADSATHVVQYFARMNSDGQLTRLVVCRLRQDYCTHHALVGDYWFRYDAPFAQPDDLDGKLAGLIDSWRTRQE
jgi:hypothetical protein